MDVVGGMIRKVVRCSSNRSKGRNGSKGRNESWVKHESNVARNNT